MNYFFLYNTNGTIYGSPYLGDAEEWTNTPSGCSVLGPLGEIDTDAQEAYLHPSHYIIQNEQFVAVANIFSIQLQEAKDAKITELLSSREAAIRDNFTSLTTGHTYFYGDSDQSKLRGQGVLLSLDPTITSVDWLTVDAGMITHTRDQFIAVLKEGGQHERDQHTKFYSLKAQVESTTTISDVEVIVW